MAQHNNVDFGGRRVLVVEDEAMIALLLEETLAELGCNVIGPFAGAEGALEWLESHEPVSAALLDVNLSHGRRSYPVAESLTQRGVPFTFVTGYGAEVLDVPFEQNPRLQKPFARGALVSALERMMGPAGRGA